jgi:hypothetical protein
MSSATLFPLVPFVPLVLFCSDTGAPRRLFRHADGRELYSWGRQQAGANDIMGVSASGVKYFLYVVMQIGQIWKSIRTLIWEFRASGTELAAGKAAVRVCFLPVPAILPRRRGENKEKTFRFAFVQGEGLNADQANKR